MIGRDWFARLQQRLPAALAQAAALVAQEAQARAPQHSGALRASIMVQADGVVATAPHAAVTELQQPFLRPALLAQRDNMIRVIAEAIDE